MEHHGKASKYMLGVSMLVFGMDQHTVIALISVEAQIASQIVSSQFPVHSRLIVGFEIPECLELLKKVS